MVIVCRAAAFPDETRCLDAQQLQQAQRQVQALTNLSQEQASMIDSLRAQVVELRCARTCTICCINFYHVVRVCSACTVLF